MNGKGASIVEPPLSTCQRVCRGYCKAKLMDSRLIGRRLAAFTSGPLPAIRID